MGSDGVGLELVLGQGMVERPASLGRRLLAGRIDADIAAPSLRSGLGLGVREGRRTTTQPIPRVRSEASGRIQDGSVDAVTTTAVMPRRSRPTDATRVSTSGVLESASTAASSCMTF